MSKKDEKKRKLNNFKNKAKKMAQQKATPKTHLIPSTEWQSNDLLELRGDLFEALEKNLIVTWDALQKANEGFGKVGQIIQMIAASNIKSGKVKLNYKWNNGEVATKEEVSQYEAKAKELHEAQQAQVAQLIKNAQAEETAANNANKTGLVDANGSPIGSDIPLEDETHPDEFNAS